MSPRFLGGVCILKTSTLIRSLWSSHEMSGKSTKFWVGCSPPTLLLPHLQASPLPRTKMYGISFTETDHSLLFFPLFVDTEPLGAQERKELLLSERVYVAGTYHTYLKCGFPNAGASFNSPGAQFWAHYWCGFSYLLLHKSHPNLEVRNNKHFAALMFLWVKGHIEHSPIIHGGLSWEASNDWGWLTELGLESRGDFFSHWHLGWSLCSWAQLGLFNRTLPVTSPCSLGSW